MADEKVGGIYYTVEARTAALLTAQNEVDSSTTKMTRSFDKTDKSVNDLNKSFLKLSSVASALTAALSANQVLQYANAWTELSNKLVNAVKVNETLADVTDRVFKVSQESRSEVSATATLYGRLEKSTRSYNVSAEQLAQLTTTINKAFVVSGATSEEAAGAITQLSQGLASGALRGDEFNAVAESGSRIALALADSLGVDIGQLRTMAAQGKLTTQIVVDGLLKQGVVIGDEFAKTTQTMGQSFTVATNNITKFVGESTVVQSVVAGIGSAAVTLSENLGALSLVLAAVASIMGGRYISALTLSTAESIKKAIASRNQAAAEQQEARALEVAATAALQKAAADNESAIAAVKAAEASLVVARGTSAEVAALSALSVANARAAAASAEFTVAQDAQALASERAGKAATVMSRAIDVSKTALSLIGGPAGAAMLAASAIYYFYQRAQEARDEANKLADSANDLTAKFKDMSDAELAATILDISKTMPELTDAVKEAQKKYDDAARDVENFDAVLAKLNLTSLSAEKKTELLKDAQLRQSVAAGELQQAQNRVSQAQETSNIAQATLNGTMEEGIDLLRRDNEQVGVAAGLMNKFGNSLNFAAKEKENFNSQSLKVERPKNIQEYLDGQLAQIELQDELNDKKREQLKAEQDIRRLGGTEADVNLARERAGAEYDKAQALKASQKATKEGISDGKKAATQTEAIATKLEKLKQDSDLAATSTQELSRQQAILNAQQSLGTGATEEQIRLAGEYAAKTWDATNALKAKQQAEQGRKFAGQEIAQIQSTASPVTGEVVDPVAAINLQEQQKLEALAKYQAVDLENQQIYEDAKTAIQQRAADQRQMILMDEANKQAEQSAQLMGIAASGFDSMAKIIESAGGKSNAAYQAMFAISKGFAVAQASLNMMTAISNALALPFPANIPAMAQAAAAGAQIASTISGINYSGGRRYGGGVSAGNPYRINESGESEVFQTAGGAQAFIPNKSGKVIPASDVGGGGASPVNVVINNMASGTQVENQGYNPDTKTITLAVKEVARQLRTRNGEVSRALGDGWNVTGKSQ